MAAIVELLTRRIFRRALPTAIPIKTSPKHEFIGHMDYIWSFVFLQDNVHIVSGSDDGTMRKWDCETGLLVGEPWKVEDKVYSLALSPDGEMIACGRSNGSVQRWDTNGQMMEGIWTGHNSLVRGLSWSPSGRHLASGSWDGTILIRKSENGEVEVGPITTNQQCIRSMAYSPSGDRIASGGHKSICIWDSHTGGLLVGPIQNEGWVYSVVWSLDGSKVYCAGMVARVLDSVSGTELHRFQLDNFLGSIALSPAHNLLAGVGQDGIVQLWDVESYQPLGQPFHQEDGLGLEWVSFSPNGRYLAYGGDNKKITLRTVNDNSPELPLLATNPQDGTQQEVMPEPQSPSCHNVDATNPLAQSAVNDNDALNDPYKDKFFTASHSLSSPSPNPSHIRRLRDALSPRHQPTKESKRLPTRFFSHRALPQSPLRTPAHNDQTEPTPKGKSKAGHHEEERNHVNHSENVALGTAEHGHDKGKQREQSNAPMQASAPDDPSSPAELDSRENRALWKSIFRAHKNDGKEAPAKVLTRDPSVVEVYAKRVPKGHAVLTQPRKKKAATGMPSTSTAPVHAGGSSQAGSSALGGPVHAQTSSEGQAGSSSQLPAGHASQSSQVTAPDRTYDDADSDWRIEGRWSMFLDKICYPCGH